jgi:hypothetical protein
MLNPTLQWSTVKCAKCHKESNFICGGCGLVAYCNKKCQHEDLVTHHGEQCDALAKYLIAMIMEQFGISDEDFMIGMKRGQPGDVSGKKKKKSKRSIAVQEAHAAAIKVLTAEQAEHVQDVQRQWVKPDITNKAKLSFLMGIHHRTGKDSPLRFLNPQVVEYVVSLLDTWSLKVWKSDGSFVTIKNVKTSDNKMHSKMSVNEPSTTTTTTTATTTNATPNEPGNKSIVKIKLPGDKLEVFEMPTENVFIYREENQRIFTVAIAQPGKEFYKWSMSQLLTRNRYEIMSAVNEVEAAVIGNRVAIYRNTNVPWLFYLIGDKIHIITEHIYPGIEYVGRAGKTATEFAIKSGHTGGDVALIISSVFDEYICTVLVEQGDKVRAIEFDRYRFRPRNDGENECSMKQQQKLHRQIPEVKIILPRQTKSFMCMLNNDPDVGYMKKKHAEEILDGIAISTCWIKNDAYTMYACVLPTTTEPETTNVTVIDSSGKTITTTATSIVNKKGEVVSLMMHPFFNGYHDPEINKGIHNFNILKKRNTLYSFWWLSDKDPSFVGELERMKIPIESSKDYYIRRTICITRYDKDLIIRCATIAIPIMVQLPSGPIKLRSDSYNISAYDGDTIIIRISGDALATKNICSTMWKVTLPTGKPEFLDYIDWKHGVFQMWGVVLSTSL